MNSDSEHITIEYTALDDPTTEFHKGVVTNKNSILEGVINNEYNIFGIINSYNRNGIYLFESGPITEPGKYQRVMLFRFELKNKNNYEGLGVQIFNPGAISPDKPISKLSKDEIQYIFLKNIHKGNVDDVTMKVTEGNYNSH